jgi:hypothetical protein
MVNIKALEKTEVKERGWKIFPGKEGAAAGDLAIK